MLARSARHRWANTRSTSKKRPCCQRSKASRSGDFRNTTPAFPSTFTGMPQIGRAHVELQSLMRISYAVFCLKKKITIRNQTKQKKQKHKRHQHVECLAKK